MTNSVLNWVWDHSRSKHGARLVLLAIADRAREDGTAWMSNPELRRMTGLGERAVQTAVAELAGLNELWVGYQQGPGGVNRFRVLMQVKGKTPAESAPPRRICTPPQNLHPPAESAPPQNLRGEEKSSQVNSHTPAESAPPQNLHPPAESAPGTLISTTNSPTESSKGGAGGDALFGTSPATAPKRARRTASRPAPGPEFERWYKAYPLHKERGDAEKAWAEAIAAGADPEVLTAAAIRYHNDPQVRRGYIKHPARWLRAKCWLDDPSPPPPNGSQPPAVGRKTNYSDEEYTSGWG